MPSLKTSSSHSFSPQVTKVLGKMTLKEKIAMLAGKDDWNTMGVERLGIEGFALMDGPHGVRIVDDGRRWKGPTVSFPTGASMASCWDPALLQKVAGAIAEEVKGVGGDLLLGPCINIVRHPLNGRNFETFAEDPWLAGQLAIAYIKGIQNEGVGTSLKHFACNNQEVERLRGSSEVDERTMREIYFPAFEATIKEAKPWTVMCAYNRVNGTYASENTFLLEQVLRKEWGFDGIVISDWGATHSTVPSVQAGLDIEMPGPAKFTKGLEEAINTQQIDLSTLDQSVGRILSVLERAGKLGPRKKLKGTLNTPPHVALARKLAEESIVLLKNEKQILPLKPSRIKSIAVLGPNADQMQTSGGGSAEIDRPFRLVMPLDALRERLKGKVQIKFEEAALNYVEPPIMDPRRLKPAKGKGHGLWGEYFANMEFKGKPVLSQVDGNMNLWWGGSSPAPKISPESFSARWTGSISVLHKTNYTLIASGNGKVRAFLDGKEIPAVDGKRIRRAITLELSPGKKYAFRFEYIKTPEEANGGALVHFGVARGSDLSGQLEKAVKLAASSDIAIVFAGASRRHEQEGSDRKDLKLPGNQDELIRAVVKANPRTIVVLNVGAPIAMPWANDVAAILDVFYPGQDGGSAIADILLGKVNPSGKLPVTFPKRLEDTPAYLDYPGRRTVRYSEGIFVGYRYYDKRQVEPLYPFGFGLSYTTFKYGAIKAPKKFQAGKDITVSVTVTNTGKVRGKEVVQLYVRDVACTVARPLRELKGFAKIDLAPGKSKTVSFVLNARSFSFYDTHLSEWVAEPGEFEIQIGSSSRDIRTKAKLTLEK